MLEQSKRELLERTIAELDSVVIAFSGGADSTLLLAVSLRVLGAEKVLAVTADSPTLPRSELAEARALAAELGAEHVVVPTKELDDERFVANPPDRCFFCKQELFEAIRDLADDRGYVHVAYGATVGDLGDHRPGMRAATEAGAVAPLLDAGLTKTEVRELSRRLGLRTWDKPAMACLSSRFPYGSELSLDALRRVELAEELLRRELEFEDVRVRHHETVARIEIGPSQFGRLIETSTRLRVVSELKRLGYGYVTLDLTGFRSGSMNEVLDGLPAREAATLSH